MAKGKNKKRFRKPKNKDKTAMKSKATNIFPSLSRRTASGNWTNFLLSQGMKDKIINSIGNYRKCVIQPPKTQPKVSRVVALDCEMVASVTREVLLARVSIVNYNLECIYDKFVKPTQEVGDYRTQFSGIREKDLINAEEFFTVQKEVQDIISNRILVGHALFNDFRVLKITHDERLIRDTSLYEFFQEALSSKKPSLKKLVRHFLHENIQEGEHSSIEDARSAMKLYKMHRSDWERTLTVAAAIRNIHEEEL